LKFVCSICKDESDDMEMWRRYKPEYIIDHDWAIYLEFVVSENFTKCSRSGAQNKNKKTHDSISKHTEGEILFIHHAKRLVRARCYIFYYFSWSFNYMFISKTFNKLFNLQENQLGWEFDSNGVIWGNSYRE
jgi:hypothetical protein